MEKDLYRGRREDPWDRSRQRDDRRKVPRTDLDKTVKPVSPDKMTKHALSLLKSLLNKAFTEEGEGGPVNVAANVADPKNKPLFAKSVKRKMTSFKTFVDK